MCWCAQCAYQQHIRLSQSNINTVANRCTAAVTILLIAKAAIKVLLNNYIYSSALKKDRENSLTSITSISKIKNNDGIKKYKFVLGEMTQIFFTSNEPSY